jgi:DNA-binding phage protein
MSLPSLSDVQTDDCEISIRHLKDVRASAQRLRLCASGMRVWAKSSCEHALLVPIGTYPVNPFLRYAYRVSKSKPELIASIVVRLLREKRVALGLSMNVVAARARLSHTMVSRVERELRRPTLDTLLRITEAMGIDLWPLIEEAESTNSIAKTEKHQRPSTKTKADTD